MDAFSFIEQISQIQAVYRVTVFRDYKSLNGDKVDYVLPKVRRFTLLKLINRLIQIVKKKKLNPKIIIGIYEIPHGLLAVMAGIILKVPSAVSIIGNPAYSKLRKGFRMVLTLWILKNCDYITVTGTNSKKFLISKGIKVDKLYVLPNTLDFTPFNSNDCEKEYSIISLGRLSEEKHIEIIVQIVANLKTRIPNIRAAIGGTGPNEDFIIDLVRKFGLESNIDIKGFVPEKELVNFYNSGRVFLLTSETEGFPRTIIQAAACGVPVVASNVGDITDVIEHEKNGFLINNYSNVEEYVDRILQLLSNNSLYQKFAVNLDEKVRKQFTTKNASKVWNEIINKASQS